MPPESSTEDQVSPAPLDSAAGQGAQAAESPAADQQGASAAGSPAAGQDAEPSAQDAKPRSTLDALIAASKPAGTDTSSASESGEKGSEPGKTAAGGVKDAATQADDPGPLTDEEFHKYAPKTRARIRKFLSEIESYKAQVTELGQKAEVHDRMVSFINDAGMNRDEVNELMAVGAALKSDPFKALAMIRPHYERLVQLTGGVLPDDLRKQVEDGFLPEAQAVELAQHRARETIGNAQKQQAEQAAATNAERERLTKLAAAAGNAVSEWDSKWAASDPDYRAKAPRVQEKVELALMRAAQAGKLPRTEAEAVALAEKARKEVEAEFKQFRPARPEIKPDARGSGSPTAAAAPRDMREALSRVATAA